MTPCPSSSARRARRPTVTRQLLHLPDQEPSLDFLAESLLARIRAGQIAVDPNYIEWKSGVYAVVDCVFSSQAKYNAVVLPMLRDRLPRRLRDEPDLEFSRFIEDVDGFGADRWDRYGTEVLTRHVLSGRRKVEVCHEMARIFVERGLQTKCDLRALSADRLEALVLVELQRKVRGIGPALARYLLMLLGDESQIKPDVMILRFFSGLSPWAPRAGDLGDIEIMREVITRVASAVGTTPARLDNAIWIYQGHVANTAKPG